MDNEAKDKKKGAHERYVSPAVKQASLILFSLAGARSTYMSLTEICANVGIHKSKAFTILETLQRFGLVRKNTDARGYALGPSLISLSRKVLDDMNAPILAEPILEELAMKAGTTAALGLIADRNVFIAAKREGGGSIVVTMRVGHRFPLTYGCHGKAIAAFLPEKELTVLLKDKKLYFQGDPARFDKDKTIKDIERCRRDWFAEDLEETAPGLNAVASPVLGPNSRPTGYIVLLGLASADTARQYGPLVAEAGKALSRKLGANVDGEHDYHARPQEVKKEEKIWR